MEYKDVEEVWQTRVAQQAARYEGEIVAVTLNAKEEARALKEEIERLKNELVEARNGSGSTVSTSQAQPPA